MGRGRGEPEVGEKGYSLRFLAILGPTASGKTSLSLALAQRLAVEIISMDSRQIYRGMDIGTGKATLEERAQVPHHGLDIRNPDESYSAGEFSRDARRWMADIGARGNVPVLVGGTGFFLKALTNPMFAEPSLEGRRRRALRAFLNGLPLETLRRYALVLDPDRAGGAMDGGPQRTTRVVEMALLTGRTLSWWQAAGRPAEQPLQGLVTVLDLPRDLLYHRINRRVEEMVAGGLVEEVRGLLTAGFGSGDPGMTGAGYREVMAHLRGELTLEEATEEIQRAHRRYARRQMTWNRHQLPPGAVFLDATLPVAALVDRIACAWSRSQDDPEGVASALKNLQVGRTEGEIG